jgi:hypothetical protein
VVTRRRSAGAAPAAWRRRSSRAGAGRPRAGKGSCRSAGPGRRPTSASAARMRWRFPSAPGCRWASNTSASCSPMRITGLSAVMGSWNTMPMRWPRSSRSWASFRRSRSCRRRDLAGHGGST